MLISRILSRFSLTRRSQANAAAALQSLHATARDHASAQRTLEQARRTLAMADHPSFTNTPKRR
jgi:hypothetical protein